ncbi:23731_t:CDS:2, partial [Gigaspora margarita]
ENDLLPNKRYFEARKEILLWNGIRRYYNSYVPEIGFAICFSYNKLIYVGQQTKNIGNYNHIGIEKHWPIHCTGNSFCNNAIKKIEHAREVGQKIRACTIIQRKFIEYYYRPDSLFASELAQHYKLLWVVREKMLQYYELCKLDEIIPSKKQNPFASRHLFRLLVAGISESGKMSM